MKKYVLMAVCIIMMSMTASAISINKALLDHNGVVTLYDDLQEAINASADGDIVYLTLGTFKGPFTVNKKITIRGTGETSIIDGDVSISIPGSPELTNPILEALTVSGSVTENSILSNLYLYKCKIALTLALNGTINSGKIEKCQIGAITFGGTIDNFFIDRSNVTGYLQISSGIKGMTVTNTRLASVSANSGATGNTTFVNCNFISLVCSNFTGTIINSIIQHQSSSNQTLNSTVILNSLINLQYNYNRSYNYRSYIKIGTSSVTQNCYIISVDDICTTYDNTTLLSNNYLGTDNTVVGIFGGSTPYPSEDMLNPTVPKVTSSNLDLDMEKKELNVKLTVSPQ